MDLFSRRIVGWSMHATLSSDLVLAALQLAFHQHGCRPLLHHSDRGSQYASQAYQAQLAGAGIACSMSRTGNCYDNAVVESFFGTLKTELVAHQVYRTRDEARQAIFENVEVFYNRGGGTPRWAMLVQPSMKPAIRRQQGQRRRLNSCVHRIGSSSPERHHHKRIVRRWIHTITQVATLKVHEEVLESPSKKRQ